MGCGVGEREVRGLYGGCWWVGGGGEVWSCGRFLVVVFCVVWLFRYDGEGWIGLVFLGWEWGGGIVKGCCW